MSGSCLSVLFFFRAVVATVIQPLVLYNGTMHTLDPDSLYASAVCIQGGRIVAVGPEETVLQSSCAREAEKAGATRVVNLHGATVVPGLTDSHAHLNMEAARRTRADLSTAKSASEAAQAAVKFSKERPDLVNASGGWILGFGWDQTKWPGGDFPTHQDLDKLFPASTPVYLEQLSGHACWVNSRAIEIAVAAGDIPSQGDPPGGHVERDSEGRPTGVLSDGAMELMERHIPPLSHSKADSMLGEVLQDCAAQGLTGVHDLDSRDEDIKLMQARHARGDLGLRIYAMRDGADGSPEDPQIHTDDGLLTVRGVKFFADGAMGSWSAAMIRPYSDKRNVTGTLVYTNEEMLGNMTAWAARGYQLATHAIGDAGNRQVLDIYETLLNSSWLGSQPFSKTVREQDKWALRWRIEHAQILSASDLVRFSELGILPSMQPSHCASDLPYAVQRLGKDRASRSYAWQSLLVTGLPALPFGSDFPTAGSVPPLLGIHAAITRQTPDGVPNGGWFPEQRVTREQALRGYTKDAAFASFRERELGVIRPGFYADLTVCDRDILTVDPPQVLSTNIVGTIIGGRVIHATNATGLASVVQPLSQRSMFVQSAAHMQGKAGERLAWWWKHFVKDSLEDRHIRNSINTAAVTFV